MNNKTDIMEIDGKLGVPLSQIMHVLADQVDNIEDVSCKPFTKDKISLTITVKTPASFVVWKGVG